MLRIREEQFKKMAMTLHMAEGNLIVRVKESPQPFHKCKRGLHIREEQDSAMAVDMMKRFIAKTVLLLEESAPQWCQDKRPEEREQFVRFMIEFAWSNNIFKEINIQKMIVWYIEPGFVIPLSKYLESIFNSKSDDENYRVERFNEKLMSSKDLVEVSLDDYLASDGDDSNSAITELNCPSFSQSVRIESIL